MFLADSIAKLMCASRLGQTLTAFSVLAASMEILELGDSSVNLTYRPYVIPERYWGVWFAPHRAVTKTFDDRGNSIPIPQRDVHRIEAR